MESIKFENGSELKFQDSPKWDSIVSHLGCGYKTGMMELIASGSRCGKGNFVEQFMCGWTPDPRMVKLEDMVVDYYKGITDDMSDRDCRLLRKEFVQWCMEWGYTKAQIDKAMQDALGRNDI